MNLKYYIGICQFINRNKKSMQYIKFKGYNYSIFSCFFVNFHKLTIWAVWNFTRKHADLQCFLGRCKISIHAACKTTFLIKFSVFKATQMPQFLKYIAFQILRIYTECQIKLYINSKSVTKCYWRMRMQNLYRETYRRTA
jgi:hypothetical protein